MQVHYTNAKCFIEQIYQANMQLHEHRKRESAAFVKGNTLTDSFQAIVSVTMFLSLSLPLFVHTNERTGEHLSTSSNSVAGEVTLVNSYALDLWQLPLDTIMSRVYSRVSFLFFPLLLLLLLSVSPC